jgi:S-adenosylmethionine:tRNA ribosyltransferase-isomerase
METEAKKIEKLAQERTMVRPGPRRSGAPVSSFRLSDYDFRYPEELVATAPASPRDSSRLMVLDRRTGDLQHRTFRDLPGYLRPGDCLVLNRTKVLPARLVGRKPTGGKVELLLLKEASPGVWKALSADLKPGLTVLLDGARAEVVSPCEDGEWTLRFSTEDVAGLIRRIGLAPLPPYILKRRKRLGAEGERDLERYQTVYARSQGSVAAPTAGLHFTPELLGTIRDSGVRVAELTLHVGRGTFNPIHAEDVRDHIMLEEDYEIPPEAAAALSGARVVAVGTTSVRSLETYAATGRPSGSTGLYITPGYSFRSVDMLLTNFHQPRSTPLLLTCAFAGKEKVLAAYREAVRLRYRLFSYGDSMLIL